MPLYRAVITMNSAVLGGTGTNTWHFRTLEVTPLVADLDLLMEGLTTFYNSRIEAYADSTELRFDGEFTGIGPDEGSTATGVPWSLQGTSTGGSLPPSQCVCVSWEGAVGDRSKRGRTFFGPMALNQLQTDNGSIDNTELGQWRDAADTLVNFSEDFDNGAIGIWSRQESVFRDFVASHVSDQFASLRSRRD